MNYIMANGSTSTSNANTTSSSQNGASNPSSNSDANTYNRNGYSDPYGITSGYSTVYVAVSILICIALILLTICTLVKRRRAANLLRASGASAMRGTGGNAEWSANYAGQDDADSAYAAPSYATAMAECDRSVFAIHGAAGHVNLYDLHLHRHYAVGVEPPTRKQHADLPPNYDDVATLTTLAHSVSVAFTEPIPSNTSSSAELTGLGLSPAQSTANGFSNLAFGVEESDNISAIPAALVAANVTISSAQRNGGQESRNANVGDELPPPAYDQLMDRVQ